MQGCLQASFEFYSMLWHDREIMGRPLTDGLLLLCMASLCFGVTGLTNSEDVATLSLLKSTWQNTPPNWRGTDPCGDEWDGIICTNSQVTFLSLSNMNIKGKLPSDIGSLTSLQELDLSYNKELTGSIPTSLGNLINLYTLLLIGCGFTGQIPSELGNLRNLTILALNKNNFSGEIPPSVGNLAKLNLLDLSDNQLTGTLPVSNGTRPGLDKLLNAKYFLLSKNRLTGSIPPEIFNSRMKLVQLLFDGNAFDGEIPLTLGLLETMEVLRLDGNNLTGPIPSNIGNLKSISELHLANNKLNGPLPDLSAMNNLQFVDLSNNPFDSSEAPRWFTTLQNLTTLIMAKGNLTGQIPPGLFNLPHIETVILGFNGFNGSLIINSNSSQALQLADLRFNHVTSADTSYNFDVLLFGNPYCFNRMGFDTPVCSLHRELFKTNLTVCEGTTCSSESIPSPRTCHCQVPYQGELIFRSSSFLDLTKDSRFKELQDSLTMDLFLDAVTVCCPSVYRDYYLSVSVQFFPSDNKYFGRTEILRISFALANQSYKPPPAFGSFYFVPHQYSNMTGTFLSDTFTPPMDMSTPGSPPALNSTIENNFLNNTRNRSFYIGAAVIAVVVGIAIVISLGIYALGRKRRAENAKELSKSFASRGFSSHEYSAKGAPKLKGARRISLYDVRESTKNFSEFNEIGSGGYGKVYKGMLTGGEMVAIKRAKKRSSQGGTEFKNEIELLSRVHHKNLVGLIGFCYEEGEHIIVYEFVSNGNLREHLSGRTGNSLEWGRRVRIALDSATGLAYLHKHANPPIIHRDIKSSNILLDDNLTAKVADFGLSKLVGDGGIDAGGKSHVSTQVKGTLGYLDPEYYTTERLSEKSDVYSFGVVLLEIVTARLPIERGRSLVQEVRTTLEIGGMSAFCQLLMDSSLTEFPQPTGLDSFVSLALGCVQDCAARRPVISEVVKELESIVERVAIIQGQPNYQPVSRDQSSSDSFDNKLASR
eukprot:Gb_05936 [translate_table: standard]